MNAKLRDEILNVERYAQNVEGKDPWNSHNFVQGHWKRSVSNYYESPKSVNNETDAA
jgi:hypothetical protein